MNELIQKLQEQHGLQPEQSHGILNTIKDFVKAKFPMAAGTIDSIFPSTEESLPITPAGDTGSTEASAEKGGSFLDKISDFVPGPMGEKAEQFAKDKLGGIL